MEVSFLDFRLNRTFPSRGIKKEGKKGHYLCELGELDTAPGFETNGSFSWQLLLLHGLFIYVRRLAFVSSKMENYVVATSHGNYLMLIFYL